MAEVHREKFNLYSQTRSGAGTVYSKSWENDLTVCCFAANHRVVMFLIELQLLFQCDSHVK